MRITVGAKIFAGFLAVLVSFAGVSGYAVYRIGQLRESFRLVSGGYLRLALLVSELERIQGALVGQVASADTSSKVAAARLARDTELVRKQRQDRASRAATVARESGLADLARRLDELLLRFAELDALYEQGAWERLTRLESTRLRHETTDLKGEITRRVQRLATDLEEEERRQVWWLLGLIVLATSISAVVTFGAHFTLRPLVRMTARMRRIARGAEPLGEPFPVGAQDEIGDLAQAWNQLAAALRDREGQLVRSERLAAVGRMAAHVTHEVRNPLSSIALNAELLEDELSGPDGTPSPEGQRLLAAIGAEVDRLTAITEEYLRFARLPRPRRGHAELAEIARGVLDFARGDLATAGVAVETRLEPSALEADPDQLRQVLLNLLRNALEASPGGGKVVVETLARSGPPPGVELRVTDSGTGMSDEVAARLFEPFFTTKDRGTGLGLALTQQIVLDHGGTIRAERIPSGGTAFLVWLPVAPPKELAAAGPEPMEGEDEPVVNPDGNKVPVGI